MLRFAQHGGMKPVNLSVFLEQGEGKQMNSVSKIVALLVGPLCSRKMRVALATVIAAYAGRAGLGWDEQMVLTVLSVGVALILGIAHEDAGAKSAGTVSETDELS
jgi:hypothetical protein